MFYPLVIIFSMLLAFYSVFRSEGVQTFLVQIGAHYLSKELKTEIRIGGFDLSLRHGLVIEDILIRDLRKETLLSAHSLGVRPGMISIRKKKLNIAQVNIDQGVIQLLTHPGDSSLNLQFIIDFFAGTDTTSRSDTTPSAPWDLSVSAVRLKDTRFHFQDKNKPLVPLGMDYSNIDVNDIDLDLTDIIIDGDTINANINHLAARERCGFILHNLSGEFSVSPAFLKAHNLKIQTDQSDLSLTFDFLYDHWGAYNDFLNEVTIQAKIEPSYFDLSDIGYFASDLLVMKDRVRLSGDIKGSVSNFKARNLRFSFGKNTFFWGNVSALGLPNVEETFVDLNIKALNTNKADIESLMIPGDTRALVLPSVLSNLGVVSMKGFFTGFYNDFVANAKVSTNLGSLNSDLTLRKQKGDRRIGYTGKLGVQSFDIGKLTGNEEMIGAVSLSANLDGQGLNLADADLRFTTLIDSIYLNRYCYRNIDLKGKLTEKKFDGAVLVRDPNLNLDFNGIVDLSDTLPEFDFKARIREAQLYRLHLLERDTITHLATTINSDFTGNGIDNLDGMIALDSTVYSEGTKVVTMDQLTLRTKQDTATGKSYHLRSDFVDADITGNFSFRQLIPSLTTFIRNYIASFTMSDSLIDLTDKSDQVMKYRINLKETDEVTDMFLPFLQIATKSSLFGSYDEKKGSLMILGHSPAIHLFGLELSEWRLDAETRTNNLDIRTGCQSLYFKKATREDSLEVKVDSFLLVSGIRHDSIIYRLSWLNDHFPSALDGFASFFNAPSIDLKISHLKVYLDQKYWQIDPTNFVRADSSRINLTNISLYSEDQYLKLNGSYSDKISDTLQIGFNKVNISELDQFLHGTGIDIDGILSGQVKLTNPDKNLAILADLKIEHLLFNKEPLGDATFDLTYNDLANRFDLQSQITYKGNIGTNIPFALTGSYYLDPQHPHFNFDLSLKNLNLKMINPFVSDFMSNVNGLASGHFKITGNPEKPVVTGKLKLMRTEFKINYLNVPYSLADEITIDTNVILFDNIAVYDSLGHKSYLNGRITHQYFKDLHLGLNLDLNDFAAFNNTRAQNSIFYGKARGKGKVSITGPLDNIRISVKASTGGNTFVSIPIDLTESVGQADYILYVDPVADSGINRAPIPKKETTGLTLDLGLRVEQDAQVEVFLPNQLGNLKASGTGDLLMGMTPTSPFTLSGIYNINKGSFLFTFKNILRLPMQIREGSSISWSGDPADANVSVSAVYRTKAPLKGLTTQPEEEGIRVPVECIIRLNGKLLNPEISFGINLPNAAEDIRNLVYSSIDTNNAVVMNEQTIYLLVMNQFKPVVATSSTVDVGSTGMSLITNQFNTWLSGITQNVNVNVNYRMATATTAQEFDVGISTQLFDDRLLIDGTFGMNAYNNASIKQSSTIVGDINVQYILTKNRRWRIHAFNRTNTLNILYNNAPYTQGVGITYQRDFANFSDLFRAAEKKEKQGKIKQ
ncbi:MAG TPA: translocation/assembly module TamB domain-containing protein [Bacteroidales bacterium]|nr:translocation/assembly module TamB domain-containing protein [Bacteroidales bacterium]HPT09861.1 translocation/assembly module TamB domain-containing protein [Bacteroidales bacterium]